MSVAVARSNSAARSPGTIAVYCALAAAAGGLTVLAGLASAPTAVDGWRLAARWTARVSFLIFLPVYIASAWYRLAPGGPARGLMRRRRALGLAFATAHTIHLGSLVTFATLTDQPPGLQTMIVGGGAYLTMFAMAATSNDAAVRRLGRNWKRLHAFGIHYLWFVFAFSYFGRTMGGDVSYAPFLALALAGLALRGVARRRAGRG
jgi:sulfoxide reductase heme-binding subunit YedZ